VQGASPRQGFARTPGWFSEFGRHYPCCRRGSPRHRTCRSGYCRQNRSSFVPQHLSRCASSCYTTVRSPLLHSLGLRRRKTTTLLTVKGRHPGRNRTGATGPEEINTISRHCVETAVSARHTQHHGRSDGISSFLPLPYADVLHLRVVLHVRATLRTVVRSWPSPIGARWSFMHHG
jgi:hypothetical protein